MDASELVLICQVLFPLICPPKLCKPCICPLIRQHLSEIASHGLKGNLATLVVLCEHIVYRYVEHIMEHVDPVLTEWHTKLPRILSVVDGNQCFFGVDETYVWYNMNAIPWFFARFFGSSPLIPCRALMEYELLVAKEVTARVNYSVAKKMKSNTRHLRCRSYECSCITYETLHEMIGPLRKAMRCMLLHKCHCTRALQTKKVEESSTAALRTIKVKKNHNRTIRKGKSIVIYSTSTSSLMVIMSEVARIQTHPTSEKLSNREDEGGRQVNLLMGDGLNLFEDSEEHTEDAAHLSSYDENSAYSESLASSVVENVGEDGEFNAYNEPHAFSGAEDGRDEEDEGVYSHPPASYAAVEAEYRAQSEPPASSSAGNLEHLENATYSAHRMYSSAEHIPKDMGNIGHMQLMSQTNTIGPEGVFKKQLLGQRFSCYSGSAAVCDDYIKYYKKVVCLVTGLLMQTTEKAQVSMPQADFNRIVHNVSRKILTLTELKDISVNLNKDVDIKAVITDLFRTFHSAEVLLRELEKADDKFIKALKRKLAKRKKSIFRFLLAVCRDVTKIYITCFNFGTSSKWT